MGESRKEIAQQVSIAPNQPPWYALTAESAAEKLQVDPAQGLSAAEARAAPRSETPAQE